ncbi:SIMPL domain-containing protein [Caulobacter sp. 17J80-11]|nr:SIMPL domain-containing protein [Caulobacter sp. 17J80-11]
MLRAALAVGVTTSVLAAWSIAAAQTPPAQMGARYVPAPWWMQEPVIASIGLVRTELPANRASFSAQFQAVERTSAAAQQAAAAKVREIDAALRSYGADKVRIETTLSTRPLYEQYRDKDGNILENQRADKIDRFEVSASLRIDVRDMAVLERAYAAVQAAQPTSVGPVGFRLEPDNEVRTWLSKEAVKDAARRATLAADAAGSKLGRVKVIDPTGRACQTDVLAGWPSYGSGGAPVDVAYDGPAMASPPPPPPPPPAPMSARGGQAEPMQFTLQPPRQWLQEEACVVYGLM